MIYVGAFCKIRAKRRFVYNNRTNKNALITLVREKNRVTLSQI